MLGLLIALVAVCVALPAAIFVIGSAWIDIGRSAARLRCWRFGLADVLLAMAIIGGLLAVARTGLESVTDVLLVGLICLCSPFLWMLRFGCEDWLTSRSLRSKRRGERQAVSFVLPAESIGTSAPAARRRLDITRRSGLTAPRLSAFSLLKQPLRFDE